jgi:hypothetical protein
MNVGFVLCLLSSQDLSHMREDRSKSLLAYDVDDPLPLDVFWPQTEHSCAGFAHEEVAQIGAASGQREWRIGKDSCDIGLVAAYRLIVGRIDRREIFGAMTRIGYET